MSVTTMKTMLCLCSQNSLNSRGVKKDCLYCRNCLNCRLNTEALTLQTTMFRYLFFSFLALVTTTITAADTITLSTLLSEMVSAEESAMLPEVPHRCHGGYNVSFQEVLNEPPRSIE